MDGVLSKFHSGFLVLRMLRTLHLSGDISYINSDTFEGLRQSAIQKLDLGGCTIMEFDSQAFKYLRELTWLSVAKNPLYNEVLNMASGSSNISLQHLDLNMTLLTVPYDDVFVTLVRDYLCGSALKSLTISNNYIHQLGDVMSQCLPELEVFSCSHNEMFEHTADVLDLLNMSNILVIDFSWQANKTLQRRVTQFKGLSLIQSAKWDPLGVYPIIGASHPSS